MKKKLIILIAILFTFSLEFAFADENKSVAKVKDATDVLSSITGIAEKKIPPALLRNAYGVAVIPDLLKAGFLIGGRYGTGILTFRKDDGTYSNPFAVKMIGGSFGWQIGVSATDVILVFKSRKSVDKIREGKFTLGMDAAVAAGPVGRHVEMDTDLTLKAEIYSYSRSRGIFAGVALEGAMLQPDTEATESLYGVPLAEFEKGKGIVPVEVKIFLKTLRAQTLPKE